MELNNFKIIDDLKIRIYEVNVTTQEISKELMLNDVEIISINKHTETLEDYLLKNDSGGGKIMLKLIKLEWKEKQHWKIYPQCDYYGCSALLICFCTGIFRYCE